MALWIVVPGVVVPYGLLLSRFALRNDQIEYFLPVRMYMRDAFLHHTFLLWNPFMSGSYPMHADMQASVWNPITIGLTYLFNYNASLLSVELLLYYVIGAIGCFYLACNFSRNIHSCIVIALIYGCTGFATSILEFMSWVGSLAYLPWVIHFFYRLLKRGDWRSGIGLSVSLWLMLVSGYPSFLIYLGYCLLAGAAAYCRLLYVQGRRGEIMRLLRSGSLSLLLLLLLALPAIHSFYEYLPYYGRGVRTTDAHINCEFFSCNYPMSLLFPVAGTLVWGNDFYIGLVPVLVLSVGWVGWWRKRVLRSRDKLLIPGFLFTLLFTVGRSTPVRMWSARHLPLLDAFGFSHSVAVFLLLALVIWLAPGLDRLLAGGPAERLRSVQRAARVALVLLTGYLLSGYHRVELSSGTVRFFYYVSAAWQLLLLAVLCFSVRLLGPGRRLFYFILADLAGCVLTVVPVTGLTVTPPGVIDRSVEAFYRSDVQEWLLDPAAKMVRMRQRDPHTEVNAMKIVGRNNFPSHTQSDAYFNYVSDSNRYKKLLAFPFVFSVNGRSLDVRHLELGYNSIDVDVRADEDCGMVIQQAYYGRWRAERPEYRPSAYEGVLLEVPLRKGENRVRLFYYARDLWVEAIVSGLTLLGIGLVLLRGYWRRVRGVARERPVFRGWKVAG